MMTPPSAKLAGVAGWKDLSPEIIGRIADKLSDRERCQTIPFLSRACRQAHRDYPPMRERYRIRGQVSHSLTNWFLLAIAPSVEILTIDRTATPLMDFLPQMLAIAGSAAPHLHTLSLEIGNDEGGYHYKAEILSLAFLTTLKKLHIGNWRFPPDDRDVSINQLSALTSLQSINLDPFIYSEASAMQSKAFWSTLASLKSLRKVRIDSGGEKIHKNFLLEVSRVTQLRDLFCGDYIHERHHDNDGSFVIGLSALPQLTKLELDISLPVPSLQHVADLCLLENLVLCIGGVNDHARLNLKSTCLTRLRFRSSFMNGVPGLTSLDQLLSATAPALPHLKSLEVEYVNLETLSSTVMAALQGLTNLWIKGANIKVLPAACTALTELVSLDMSENKDLQLRRSDISTLVALPNLKTFSFAKVSGSWSQESLEVVLELRRSLPQLQID